MNTPPTGTWQAPEPGDHRGPCPGLNALANGGYLPRSGRVTADQLVHAMHERLGLAPSIGRMLAALALRKLGKPGPDGAAVLDLADLSLHGFIEHDASLTRPDARHGDAVKQALPLLLQLLSLTRDGRTLTLEDLAVAHQLRMAQSREGGHRVPLKAAALGTLEAALVYLVLGRDGGVAIADAREFFQHERIPASVEAQRIGWGTILRAAVQVAVMGNLPSHQAAQRAQKVVRDRVDAAPAQCPFPHGGAAG
jgi:Peroxidase, family 2